MTVCMKCVRKGTSTCAVWMTGAGREKINKSYGELSKTVIDTLSPRLSAEPLKSACDEPNQSERESLQIYLSYSSTGRTLPSPAFWRSNLFK